MSDKRLFVLAHQQARMRAAQAVAEAPEGYSVLIAPPKRTDLQNSKLWAMLRDLSQQVVWHSQRMSDAEWKAVLTAGLKKQRAVPGIDGGFVILGAHTSGMSRRDLAELIDLMYDFGAQQGVEWTEPAPQPA